ncbi:MAG TPA: hypothetical protein VMG55_14525 [Stellaceae bacterium]|nr:hypothetical protein [Stellaceae bacterium]
MILSSYSLGLVLDLIEDRINQLDPLTPQDEQDLEALIRCREEMKVTARVVSESDDGEYGGASLRDMARHETAAMSPSLDVI